MKNEKILEMLNNSQIEELKNIIKDEIYQESLGKNQGERQRYAAMKRYFKFKSNNINVMINKPASIDYIGESYISFTDSYSITLTKESSGEIELIDEEKDGKYLDISTFMDTSSCDEYKINFNKVLAEAKSLGYKSTKNELTGEGEFKYCFKFNDSFYRIGSLDKNFSIINDGQESKVYHQKSNKLSPITIENSVGVSMLLPVNINKDGIIDKKYSDLIIINVDNSMKN